MGENVTGEDIDMRQKIRLIAFDMDGTVLDDHKRILPETKEAFARAVEQGIVLLPATGRHFSGAVDVIREIDGVEYITTCNGAGIYELASGHCLFEESMELSSFLPMLKRLDELEVAADPFVKGEALMNERKWSLVEEMHLSPELEQYMWTSRKRVPDLLASLEERGDDVEKLTINFVVEEDGTRRDYDEVLSVLADYPQFDAVPGGMYNIEVTKKGISKGSGLRWIGQRLGISTGEMIAFGDSGNDLSMLETAGIGVAMGNAEKEAKEMADYVTKTNNENGIAFALHKFCPNL